MRAYTVFVDESGDAGIRKIRSSTQGGASPYLTLGAALIPDIYLEEIREELEQFRISIGKKNLHATDLNHVQKVRLGQKISSFRILCFGVISRKQTLGSYSDEIKSDPKKYYNKCTQYLLERIGMFVSENEISSPQISFCFEKGNFDYQGMKGLISLCKKRPLQKNTKYLEHISLSNSEQKEKLEEPLLQLADYVAHALYRCTDRTQHNLEVLEPRYLDEIRTKFYSNQQNKRVLKYGIYPVHDASDLQLEDKIYH